MSINKIVSVFLCAATLCSCSSAKQEEWFVTHTGNMPTPERIEKIQQGISQEEVLQTLGMPSAVMPFDKNTWIYMASDIKRVAFFAPEETDRNILKITFNDQGTVTAVEKLTKADGKEISPSKDKTEVKGQNPGFFRKYFGGVGQYNPFAGQQNPGL